MNRNKYCYSAVFTPEKKGAYSVIFPDFEGCYTCGESLADAVMMAEDVLAFTLYEYEREGRTIPKPSEFESIKIKKGEFINLIACDTLEYRKRFDKSAVKKTLTIPSWLNYAAMDKGINFSQVLQDALMERV